MEISILRRSTDVLLNLFLSILFKGFEEADEVSDRQEKEAKQEKKSNKHTKHPDERSVELEDVEQMQARLEAKEMGEEIPEGMGPGALELERHSGWANILGTDIVLVEKGFTQHKGSFSKEEQSEQRLTVSSLEQARPSAFETKLCVASHLPTVCAYGSLM